MKLSERCKQFIDQWGSFDLSSEPPLNPNRPDWEIWQFKDKLEETIAEGRKKDGDRD